MIFFFLCSYTTIANNSTRFCVANTQTPSPSCRPSRAPSCTTFPPWPPTPRGSMLVTWHPHALDSRILPLCPLPAPTNHFTFTSCRYKEKKTLVSDNRPREHPPAAKQPWNLTVFKSSHSLHDNSDQGSFLPRAPRCHTAKPEEPTGLQSMTGVGYSEMPPCSKSENMLDSSAEMWS